MVAFAQTLQLISGAAWLAVAALLLPGFVRIWTGKATRLDAQRNFVFGFAMLQVAFIARWLAWDHSMEAMVHAELVGWGTLYLVSTILAASIVWRHFQSERERK